MNESIDPAVRFNEEAMPHFDAVHRFALSLAREAATAEDLVQDTFLQAFRRFETFELGTNCKAWLFRICKNRFIDAFRARQRRPVHQDIESKEPKSPELCRESRIFEQRQLNSREFQERVIESEELFLDLFGDEVNQFLAELPEEFRTALLLCDLEGLQYQEISGVVGVPIGTVRSRISRARAFLRERLEDYAAELGYLCSGDAASVCEPLDRDRRQERG